MAAKEKTKKPFYKKWWVWALAIIVIAIAASSGEDEKEETTSPKEEVKVDVKEKPKEEAKKEVKADVKEKQKEKVVKTVTQEEFESYARNIKGGTFIKTISVSQNKGNIEYFSTFDEYKTANPQGLLTEDDYKGYFDSGEAIQKIFVGENVRLLRQFPALDSTSMTLSFDGKSYSIDLKRDEVNAYLGFKVEELSTNDGSWNSKFSDPYIYSDEKRQAFFNKFATVK
ncbi:hypothetical protein [Bacillus massiliigorillae]|uniref:hypothetical protein n=1 Tax=Bacillus massiliigorillae TaxID=1243664 RepID=UPI0003AAE7CF|nr:hypothetical protein [Bacillus massiliigorillae]